MTCKGICQRYKAPKPLHGSRYGQGQKRCQICAIFLIIENTKAVDPRYENFCICCKYKLRTVPRNRKFKLKVKAAIAMQS